MTPMTALCSAIRSLISICPDGLLLIISQETFSELNQRQFVDWCDEDLNSVDVNI